MNKRTFFMISAIVAVLLVTGTVIFAHSRSGQNALCSKPQPAATAPATVAGPGLVEPESEDIKLGSELSGKLRSVDVEEGDPVHKGQVLAVIENDDYRAQVLSAEAEVAQRQAILRKVINGARSQERLEALSSVREARAVMDNALSEKQRRERLYEFGVVSREETERYAREYEVAREKYQAAMEHHSLIDDRPREEDQSSAEADLALARARLEEARARYEKTFIRSPIDGTVLRKHHRTGESVSNSSTVPDPVVTIGNKAVLRVRVDVDETEVSKVRVGQKAYVTADAYGGQKFWGHVVRVGERLGRKNIRTDEPTERVDTKILETLIELDRGTELPVGLRVDSYIVLGPQEAATTAAR